jgi:hypothetical protein
LPEHVAVIATLRHWWDASWRSQELYTFAGAAKTQYLLYYVVGALLAVPLGNAEAANLAILCATGIAFPYALRALLRALGRDERLAVFACPLFWNRALAVGLLNYVASIPIVVWGIALAIRQAEAPERRRAGLLACLAVVLFYLHLSGFVVFVGAALLVTLLLPTWPPGRAHLVSLPRRMLWLAPVAFAAGLFALTSAIMHPEKSQGVQAGVVRFSSKLLLARELPAWLHDVWRSRGDDLFAAIAWAAFALLLLRRGEREESRGPRVVGLSLLLFALALYFFLPAQVSFAFLLDFRNAPFIGLFAPLVLPLARDDARTRAGLLAMTFASVGLSLHAAWQMHAYERDEAGDFEEIVRNLPRGKKLLTLTFVTTSRYVHVSPFVHFGAYYRMRYGGIASFSFAELPHWPVQYRTGKAPPAKKNVFWDWSPCLFRNSHDGPYYDYVMARGDLDPFAAAPPGPTWHAIGGAGEWRLWERDPDSWSEGNGAEDLGPCALPDAKP